MDDKFAKVNDVRLHYKESGEGKLIIFLHGFPEFWYSWRKQIPFFAQHYKVIAPDLRGYNDSDKPVGIKNYHINVLVEDVKQLIEKNTSEKAIVVGHDWGGAVAWKLGMAHPELVEKLVILNCPHPYIFQSHLKSNLKQLTKSWYIAFFQLPILPEFFIKLNLEMFFRRTLKGWSHNKEAFTEEDIAEYVKAFKKRGALIAAINYYRAAAGNSKSLSSNSGILQMPVRMLWGEDDKALGKELTYGTEQYCPAGFEIQYLTNCSHWIQHEYPDLVNENISEFIK